MDIGEEGSTEAGSIHVEGETILVDALTNSRKLGHDESIFSINDEHVTTYLVPHYHDDTFFVVNSVRLPRHVADKRMFCGTALVEFSSEKDAANILKQNLVYDGVELELKPK
ncbi:hypothetical protein RND71_016277 [Anisodus tanguticus]|uniref:RRM domain-containing protein n=1 Tax=Anisodus tanguticus TaxID=243964 RepID=A0AAE1S5V0_9SOLA|nr:hypothetical protein RND71_016277 [Anisodus tanguticus]